MLLSKAKILKDKPSVYFSVIQLNPDLFGSGDVIARFSTIQESLIFCSEFKNESSFPCAFQIRIYKLKNGFYEFESFDVAGDFKYFDGR